MITTIVNNCICNARRFLSRRRKNVRGAYAVNRDVSGKNVAIIDDVMTSGATADALAAVLTKAGAQRVEVWMVARA